MGEVNPIYTLTVTDPRRPGRVLASHEGLSAWEAGELTATYLALGYDVTYVVVEISEDPRVA